jgi:hypothetical protein
VYLDDPPDIEIHETPLPRAPVGYPASLRSRR